MKRIIIIFVKINKYQKIFHTKLCIFTDPSDFGKWENNQAECFHVLC